MKKWITRFFSSAITAAACLVLPSFDQGTSQVSTQSEIKWLNSFSAAQQQARANSKPILILFTGTQWCPACIKLEKDVLMKPEFMDAVKNRFVFVKAEFPKYDENSIKASPYFSLMERYGISLFPTLIIVDADGNHLFTVNYKAAAPQAYAEELNNKLQYYQNLSAR